MNRRLPLPVFLAATPGLSIPGDYLTRLLHQGHIGWGVMLGRTGLSLILLVAFSAGLAVVLTATGLVVLYAKHWLPDGQKAASHAVFRYLPVVSAAIVVCIGVVMTWVSLRRS